MQPRQELEDRLLRQISNLNGIFKKLEKTSDPNIRKSLLQQKNNIEITIKKVNDRLDNLHGN